MTQSVKSGFLRDDTTGALVVTGTGAGGAVVNGSVLRTANAAAGNDYTTTSATVIPIDSTNLTITLACTGAPVDLRLSGSWGVDTATNDVSLGFQVDGVAIVTPILTVMRAPNAGWQPLDFSWRLTPTAGSRVFRPTWSSLNGMNARIAAQSTRPLLFTATEIT